MLQAASGRGERMQTLILVAGLLFLGLSVIPAVYLWQSLPPGPFSRTAAVCTIALLSIAFICLLARAW
jgi:hypothetical protein